MSKAIVVKVVSGRASAPLVGRKFIVSAEDSKNYWLKCDVGVGTVKVAKSNCEVITHLPDGLSHDVSTWASSAEGVALGAAIREDWGGDTPHEFYADRDTVEMLRDLGQLYESEQGADASKSCKSDSGDAGDNGDAGDAGDDSSGNGGSDDDPVYMLQPLFYLVPSFVDTLSVSFNNRGETGKLYIHVHHWCAERCGVGRAYFTAKIEDSTPYPLWVDVEFHNDAVCIAGLVKNGVENYINHYQLLTDAGWVWEDVVIRRECVKSDDINATFGDMVEFFAHLAGNTHLIDTAAPLGVKKAFVHAFEYMRYFADHEELFGGLK